MNTWNLEYASEVRSQLAELCHNNNLQVSSCGNNMERVRKVFLTGLFMNLAELQRDKTYLTVSFSISIVFFFISYNLICLMQVFAAFLFQRW